MKRKLKIGMVGIVVTVAGFALGASVSELLINNFKEFVTFIISAVLVIGFNVANAG